eukprot:1078035-Prorocentrum_minimum.AAC.2
MENLEKDEKNLDAKIEKRKAALEISEKRLNSLEVRVLALRCCLDSLLVSFPHAPDSTSLVALSSLL